MKHLILWVLLFQGWALAQSWKRPEVASQWFFGKNAGLDFRNGAPTQVGALCVKEGCSTICDSISNLLFYTDGIKVFNKNHQLMQNGDSLGAGEVKNFGCTTQYQSNDRSSSTQGALIIPFPNNPEKYYVFTTRCEESQDLYDSTQYSIISFEQDTLGQVIEKNKLLFPDGTEKQCAVKHTNGRDWWHISPKT